MSLILEKCPHCGVAHVQTSESHKTHFHPTDGETRWYLLHCNHCKTAVLAVTKNEVIERIYPSGHYKFDEKANIPDGVRSDYREAAECLDVGCYKASMVMSRRALQQCLKEQGCNQHKLVDAINHAIQNQILRKTLHPIAEEIRQFGNLSAHPDDDQLGNANQENASQILSFVKLIIHEFYEVPASAERLQRARKNP